MKNGSVWLVVAALVAAVLGGGAAWGFQAVQQGRIAAQLLTLEQQGAALQSRADSLTVQIEAAAAAAVAASATPAPTAAKPPAAPAKPKSFTTFAYVKKVVGPYNETFTIHIDPFLFMGGQEAVDYAAAHHVTLPANGLLFINSSTTTSAYPLAQTATVVAYSGSVEAPTAVPMDGGLLQQWVSDHSVVAGLTDMWKVTVKNGSITRIEMLVVAD